MKLRNKKTGEIKEVQPITIGGYRSLAELNEEWEDYEEPEEHWHINSLGEVEKLNIDENFTSAEQSFILNNHLEIGNYFETKEEAEKAVEKLKAWKRLKDNGLVIKRWCFTPATHIITGNFLEIEGFIPEIVKNTKDLDLLFGGEE